MNIKLKNNQSYNITSLREERVILSDGSISWILNFIITDEITSNDIDVNITIENISEFSVLGNCNTLNFTGYNKIIGASIVFDDTLATKCAVRLQKLPMKSEGE